MNPTAAQAFPALAHDVDDLTAGQVVLAANRLAARLAKLPDDAVVRLVRKAGCPPPRAPGRTALFQVLAAALLPRGA